MLPAGQRPWDGLRVLVTAGGTREPIDAVRFLGNRSSGRMGIALAAAAARRGAEVTLIAANVSLPEPAGVRRIDVETAAELAAAARGRVPLLQVLLMAAAPADFRAAEAPPARCNGEARWSCAWSRPRTSSPGSPRRAPRGRRSSASPPSTARAASSGRAQKLERKGADLIVLNDVSDPAIGFESEENAVTLIVRARPQRPICRARRAIGRDRWTGGSSQPRIDSR